MREYFHALELVGTTLFLRSLHNYKKVTEQEHKNKSLLSKRGYSKSCR